MADIFAGALRGSHQFAAQAQDDWTSKVAAQLQVATKAPPEQQGVELAKLQEMQHSRANAEKTKSKLVVGGVALALGGIVVWGRLIRRKRRKQS